MTRLLLVVCGGAVGSGARFWLSDLVMRRSPPAVALYFPVGTLTVNLAGCLLFGIAVGLFRAGVIGENWRLFLLAGICGGFTTFSAFSSDTLELLQAGNPGYAILNVAVQVLLGLAVLWVGIVAVQRLS